MSAPIQGLFPTNPITAAKALDLFTNVQRDYGAVGDGSTDDTTAFASFTAAVGTDGTGYIPAGTYSLTSLPTFAATADYWFDPGAVLVLNGTPQARVTYYHPVGAPINVLRETFASGSSATTTGAMTANSKTLTLTAAEDFRIGQGIRVAHAGASPTLSTPSAPTVTAKGTTGSTAWSYAVAALDGKGGETAASSVTTIADGNATLSATNYNALSWTAVANASGYAVYRTAAGGTPAATGLIGITFATSLDDTGLGIVSEIIGAAANAPSAALGDHLITQILDGAGTATLTLKDAATAAVTSATIAHDDTDALQGAITTLANVGSKIMVPAGFYRISGLLTLTSGTQLEGASVGAVGVTSDTLDRFTVLSAESMTAGIKIPTDSVTVDGIGLRGLVFLYPDQQHSNHPLPYASTIISPYSATNYNLNYFSVSDCVCIGAYQFLDLEGRANGGTIRDCKGWAWEYFLRLDQAVDVVFIENIHANLNLYSQYYSVTDDTAFDWSYQNSNHFELGYNDSVIMSNIFLGANNHRTLLFFPSTFSTTTAGWYQISNLQTDMNHIDIEILANTNFDFCQFINCYFSPGKSNSGNLSPLAAVVVDNAPTGGPISFADCTFEPGVAAPSLQIAAGNVNFNNCKFQRYNNTAPSFTNAGRTTLEFIGCYLNENNTWTFPAIAMLIWKATTTYSGQVAFPSSGIPNGWFVDQRGFLASFSGTTAGTLWWSYKLNETGQRILIYLDGYENDTATAQTITFPFPFRYAPNIANPQSVPGVSATATQFSIAPNTATAYTGYLILEGL